MDCCNDVVKGQSMRDRERAAFKYRVDTKRLQVSFLLAVLQYTRFADLAFISNGDKY